MNNLIKIGGFSVSNFDQLHDVCVKVSSTSLIPKSYQGKPSDIFSAVLYGSELGFGFFASLNAIAVVNGRPCIYGDGLLAIASSHKDFKDMVEEELPGGAGFSCTIKRHGKEDLTRVFTVDDAKKANLFEKPGPWTQYPRRMLQMRARGFAIRDAFSDVLSGLVSAEEAADMPIIEKEINQVSDPNLSASNILKNKLLKSDKEENQKVESFDVKAEITEQTEEKKHKEEKKDAENYRFVLSKYNQAGLYDLDDKTRILISKFKEAQSLGVITESYVNSILIKLSLDNIEDLTDEQKDKVVFDIEKKIKDSKESKELYHKYLKVSESMASDPKDKVVFDIEKK